MEQVRVAVADGVRLAVWLWPGQRALSFLLVHGLASNARMWDGVAVELARAGCPVAAVDLRGHGQSDKPDDGYDTATVVADLEALIGALGWERPVVVGQSWGGNVVVELAYRRPDLVAGVAGVDGGEIELWRRFPEWDDCARELAPPPLEGAVFSEVEPQLREYTAGWPEAGVQGMLANFEVRPDQTIAPWLTRERHMKVLRGLWEHRPSELLASIEVPLLMIPASTVEDGHHDLHAQHPDVVAALLLEKFG